MRATPTPRTPRRRSRRASYDAYLASRAWSDKRKQWYAAWLSSAGIEPSCLVCGRSWTLKSGHLHHTTYARLGDESLTDLVPLCRRDHRALHALIDCTPTWRRTDRRTATAGIIALLRAARTPATAPEGHPPTALTS
jgi:5-methylcytosine-specific restriction endonuclease McrA